MIAESTITCPHCGFAASETMPADACQFLYECKGCGTLLRPKPGDCCVFCSFGTVPCPPVQAGASHSGGGRIPAAIAATQRVTMRSP
ncbi:MAG TPA: GDCCVxC domain-containing (seleno)protein [Acetobacteraceae bacterium]|nr:GDCCVxC domain-containing (seleno)protein [Acetobacteraceae bacterium]